MAQIKRSILVNKMVEQRPVEQPGLLQEGGNGQEALSKHQSQLSLQKRHQFNKVRFSDKNLTHATPNSIGGRDNSQNINIVSWNSHNIKPFEYRQKFLELKAHVMLLQEVNKQMKDRTEGLGYRWHTKERNDKLLAIACTKNMISKRREDLETTNSIIVQVIFGGRFSILLGSIHQTIQKKEYRTVLDRLQMHASVLGGDLNYTVGQNELRTYNVVSEKKDRKRQKNKKLDSNINRNIDYIFIQQAIRFEQKYLKEFYNIDFNPSDHRPVMVAVEMPEYTAMHFPFFDQKRIMEYVKIECKGIETVWDLINAVQNIPNEIKVVKFGIPKYREWDLDYQTKLEETRCTNAKEYFRLIKHTAKVGKQKAGQIANVVETNGVYETNYKQIIRQTLLHIINIQQEMKDYERYNRKWKRLLQIDYQLLANLISMQIPVFEEESKDSINERKRENRKEKIRKYVKGNLLGDRYKAYKKAISYDWVTLGDIIAIWKRQIRKMQSVYDDTKREIDILDIHRLMNTKYTLQMRLIPINKVCPKIPKGNQIRPICVQSHVIKLIEMFYTQNLQRKMKYDIDVDQTGFVPGLGVQMNLWQITEYIRNKNEKNKALVFIDLSNAYNTVNREKLYEIIIKNKWMDVQAADFLMTLYDEMYYWEPIEERRIYLKNGLHQGSLIAPMLFNLYFYDLLREWRTRVLWEAIDKKNSKKKKIAKMLQKSRALTYADDIVIMAERQVAGVLFNTLRQVAEEYSMQMNVQKCAYLSNKNIEELELMQCKKTNTYKYLGVWLTTKGSLIYQYKQQVGMIMKNAWRLRGIHKLMPMRHLVRLWSVFIKPYFDYISPLLWMQKKTVIRKYETLWRRVIKTLCGLQKSFSTEVIETIFGQLPFYVQIMENNVEQANVERIQESKQNINVWGFKDLEEMQVYIVGQEQDKREYRQWVDYLAFKSFPTSGLRRAPFYTEMRALQRRIIEIEEKLDKKMEQYEEKNKKFLQEAGKKYQKVDTNRIRKVPNFGYFDQWRYTNVRCKEHNDRWFNREHILEHMVEKWPKGRNMVQELDEMNEWILGDKNFGVKCAEKKNNIMKGISNKIRKIIEECGIFFHKKKKEEQK